MNQIDTSIGHITPAGGNIFADLGFDSQEATKLKIKAQLMSTISMWIKGNSLKQAEAAHLLQVTRPRISDVTTGKTSKFTIDALIDMLDKTDYHVTVHINS